MNDAPWFMKVLMAFGISILSMLMGLLFAVTFMLHPVVGIFVILVFLISLYILFENQIKELINKLKNNKT